MKKIFNLSIIATLALLAVGGISSQFNNQGVTEDTITNPHDLDIVPGPSEPGVETPIVL